MLTFLGAPLFGKLFMPILALGVVMLILIAVTQWVQGGQKTHKQADPQMTPPTLPATEENCNKPEINGNIITADSKVDEPIKKQKKKKSCCGTKGSCCKTKKETGEEKKGSGCGCGCGTKKKDGEEADNGSCSSEASDSDGDVPQLIDVEELGRIAEGLLPNLVTNSSPKPPRTPGAPIGRVRLRNSEQAKQSAVSMVSSQS